MPGSPALHALGLVLVLAFLPVCSAAGPDSQPPHWNNIEVIRENVEPPRAWFIPYPAAEAAKSGDTGSNPWFRLLNGDWKFHYADSPTQRPAGFFRQEFDDSDWATIPVPSNWERQGFG
jgi:hypothetical protein